MEDNYGDGTSWEQWMLIIKGILKNKYNYEGELNADAYREFYDNDYSCEQAINQLFLLQ